MSPWGRRRIKDRALELLRQAPDGLASADLAMKVKEEAGVTPFSTIHAIVTALPYESREEVLEPRLGWLVIDRRKKRG